jgi:hypothetical protein
VSLSCLADDEERTAGSVALEGLKQLRRKLRVGPIIERERCDTFAGRNLGDRAEDLRREAKRSRTSGSNRSP